MSRGYVRRLSDKNGLIQAVGLFTLTSQTPANVVTRTISVTFISHSSILILIRFRMVPSVPVITGMTLIFLYSYLILLCITRGVIYYFAIYSCFFFLFPLFCWYYHYYCCSCGISCSSCSKNVFHSNGILWSFTEVRVTASLFKFPGRFFSSWS